MAYELKIHDHGEYLHARIEGVSCARHFIEIWNRVGQECRKRWSARVLCEGCLEGMGMTMDVHEYRTRMSRTGMPVGTRIAICCSEEDCEQFNLLERGMTTDMPVFPRIFSDLKAGVGWLTR